MVEAGGEPVGTRISLGPLGSLPLGSYSFPPVLITRFLCSYDFKDEQKEGAW